jgi:hypothetical protein
VKGINTGYQPAELRKAGIWGVSGRNNTQASQSARGLAQSKTLSRQLATQVFPAGLGDDMSSWLAGAEALHQPTVCSNKN